jgi:DNA modification methylase
MGSGTTGKMAILNNRNFIGVELNEDFAKEATERIKKYANG